MKRNLFILLFIALFGCSKGQAFLDVGNISVNHEFLIVPMRSIINEIGSTENLLIPEPILIENPKTIESIINSWGTKESGHPGFPYYIVLLTENKKVIRTVFLNNDLSGMFTRHGFYQFSKDELFQYEDEFKYLKWLNIKVKDIEKARELIDAISSQRFIFPEFISPNGDFQNFSGEFTVHISSRKDIDEYEPLLKKELNDSSIFLIRRAGIATDSVELTIRTMADISSTIPSGYILTKDWEEYINIEFEIVGIEKDQVISIAKKLGINAEIK
jgi:hypothetical protein